MTKKLFKLLVLACLAGFAGNELLCAVAGSLPPLKDGRPPQDLQALWAGYNPRQEPLKTEVLKQWEQEGVVMRVVRYRIGIFKDRKAMMAAIYGFPQGSTNLPGLVQIHGGGQYADYRAVLTNAKRGYATISIAWAGRLNAPDYLVDPKVVKLFWDDATNDPAYKLTTDWGSLDGYHAPCRFPKDDFVMNPPSEHTLDPVESPRNSGWFLCTLAARRALTFLERQPEVDANRLGVYGHSMGGNLTLFVAGTDRRVKAAVITSAGGIGDPSDNLKNTPFSNAAYAARVTCTVLFVNPSDDFHGTILGLEETARTIQSKDFRFSRPPQLNHRSMPEFTVASMLWFDHYLQGAAPLPETPVVSWNLNAPGGTPLMMVKPDPSRSCESVDVYYTQDDLKTDPKSLQSSDNRFWHHFAAQKTGVEWQAHLPVFSVNRPLWAYANVRCSLPKPVTGAGFYYGIYTTTNFTISSRLLTASAKMLQAADVQPTLKVSQLIENFAPGWQGEWFTDNYSGEWPWRTHKLNSDEWPAPPGARLAVNVRSAQPNKLVVQLDDYAAQTELKGGGEWQTVSFAAADFHDALGAELSGWKQFEQLALADKLALEANKHGKKISISIGAVWQGAKPEFRDLRWLQAPVQNGK